MEAIGKETWLKKSHFLDKVTLVAGFLDDITIVVGGFGGLMELNDRRAVSADDDPALPVELAEFGVAMLLRFAETDVATVTGARDLFIPAAILNAERAFDAPLTIRFGTMATARFIGAHLVVVAGRPMLDSDEFERDEAAEMGLVAAIKVLRARGSGTNGGICWDMRPGASTK